MSRVAGERPTKSAKRERPKRLQLLLSPDENAKCIIGYRRRIRKGVIHRPRHAAVIELLSSGKYERSPVLGVKSAAV